MQQALLTGAWIGLHHVTMERLMVRRPEWKENKGPSEGVGSWELGVGMRDRPY